jgi:hypothetical protein
MVCLMPEDNNMINNKIIFTSRYMYVSGSIAVIIELAFFIIGFIVFFLLLIIVCYIKVHKSMTIL